MKVVIVIATIYLQAVRVCANGLVGYGIYPYTPYCAFACLRSLDSFALGCSMDMPESGGHSMAMMTTTPQCRAQDTSWLTSLAYCVQAKCADSGLVVSDLERFWEQQSTEDPATAAKWGYTTSLQHVGSPPNESLATPDDTINRTVLVNPNTYLSQYNALSAVQDEVTVESTFGIVLLVAGFGIPIVATWAGHIPFIKTSLRNMKPYFVYPSLIGTYHARPLPYQIGNAPTRGQSWYLAIFVALNVILSAVDYRSKQPHAWYADRGFEIAAYVAYRTGVYALVVVPLMVLFSSRNNFLLWITNWSYSTYMLLHRWMARLFVVYSLIHTLIFVALWCINGSYSKDSQSAWWKWGIVAVVLACALLISSAYWVRRNAYETFLLIHIIMAMFVVIGMYYHVVLWLPSWGWQNWIFTAVAVWAFDRVARLARMASVGLCLAKVSRIGEGYVRVDIEGIVWSVEPGRHAFCYFPTLMRYKFWENHPFSIVPTAMIDRIQAPKASESESKQTSLGEKSTGQGLRERHSAKIVRHHNSRVSSGITLFIKASTGTTRALRATDALLTLVEGPYPSTPASTCLLCERILLVGGGIGITGLVTWIPHHSNIKLAWSMKESAECLVKAFDPALSCLEEKIISVGARLNLEELIAEESRIGWDSVGVVVSGPPAMCDVVRALVARTAQHSETHFELIVDSFSF